MAMATHLTASMRVICAHRHRPRLTVEQAVKEVKEAAFLVGTGADVPDARKLAAKLEKACGCTIAELAAFAEAWPD